MDTDKVIEFAPYILVILMFFFQNKVFVRPADLEKKHREILNDVKRDFVELNAYKEFQSHVYSKMDEMNHSLNEIKGAVMQRRKDDL